LIRLALPALLALAACGPSPVQETYAPGNRHNFMEACTAQPTGSESLCSCVWDRIEANVAYADFVAFDRMTPAEREAHPLQDQIEQFALSCAPVGTEGSAPR